MGIEAMDNEERLKLQAWLDGELPTHEASRVADWVEANPLARELADELRAVKMALQVGELTVAVEDSREFYWSQTAQRIDAVEVVEPVAEAASALPWMEWCRQWLVPVGGLAAIVMMISQAGLLTNDPMPEPFTSSPDNDGDLKRGSSAEGVRGAPQKPVSTPTLPDPVIPRTASKPHAFVQKAINGEGEPDKDSSTPVKAHPLNDPNADTLRLLPGQTERTIPNIENPER